MNVSFKGIGEQAATFIANAGLTGSSAGIPVKISANGTVNSCSAGDVPCGVCIAVRNGYCSVQLKGYYECVYTVNTGDGAINPALGTVYLVADGSGKFKAAASGLEVLVVSIDSTNHKIGFIIQ